MEMASAGKALCGRDVEEAWGFLVSLRETQQSQRGCPVSRRCSSTELTGAVITVAGNPEQKAWSSMDHGTRNLD